MVANTLPAPKPAFKVAGDRMTWRKSKKKLNEYEHIPNPWEKYRLKLVPKRINGRWYKPGSWVYRKWVMTPSGGYWKYGDDFDFMRGR